MVIRTITNDQWDDRDNISIRVERTIATSDIIRKMKMGKSG